MTQIIGIVVLSIIVLVLIGSAVFVVWSALTAGPGWEDETGFHRGLKE